MSNLTVALAILGGLVLATVVGYNAWMSRRNAPKQPDAPVGEAPAPEAAPAGELEPVLHVDPHQVPGNERHEPLFDPDLPAPSALAVPSAERRGGLDPLIDVIAPVSLDGLASGDAAIAAMPATRRAGSKPVAVEGLNEFTGQWEPAVAGQRYGAFQVGVQMANRTGALNEIEYSEFVVKAQAFADAVNGAPEFPEMLDEVARARELDQFASSHDAQLSFVLRARHAAWSPGYVQQNAARLGFVAGIIPGRMVLPAGEQGLPPLLGLSFDTQAALADDPAQSAIRELTLSLDVPQVDRIERPFERMREAAAALVREMDGVVTDSDGQPLREETMDAIGIDLEQLYDTLDARDLSAGSPLARRLFS
ncbi:cell division protein ZipA C-terminal FtsZ-binding domain-containing protein [Variovorax saccharolyticus]|uniref:cell division protein ZipA C-terminal FtsZ-binding domain-containing protein n=1 Tax=Variovorax saccharolyticus TaxID=3053516 RepID=UPI0025768AA4|nr:cell division protein ZipA C-terminal FtsZ-binding domain-containing protein [Variovorax sp. J22R187]MDM0020140.1 cell division protein ZipA C-terminal FtsZ-binding domain-containing protein [Variovorax sp. J22R187]